MSLRVSHRAPIKERLLAHIEYDTNGGCWLWWRSLSSSTGRPQIHMDGKNGIAARASYRVFKGEPGDLQVCHSCDNKLCINPDHLWLGTHEENMADRGRKGLCKGRPPPAFGSGHKLAKLTEAAVAEIKRRAHEGEAYKDLAKEFGISPGVVSRIMRGIAWKHVTLP